MISSSDSLRLTSQSGSSLVAGRRSMWCAPAEQNQHLHQWWTMYGMTAWNPHHRIWVHSTSKALYLVEPQWQQHSQIYSSGRCSIQRITISRRQNGGQRDKIIAIGKQGKCVHPPPLQGSRSPLKNMILLPNFSRTELIFWQKRGEKFLVSQSVLLPWGLPKQPVN